MDFSYSQEQQDIKTLLEKILNEQASAERQKKLEDSGERFDRDLWQTLAKAGMLGIAIKQEYGGMGFGFSELSVLFEEVGRAVAPVPAVPVLAGAALAIQQFGSQQQKSHWLPSIVDGSALVSVALLEPEGDDPALLSTLAKKMDKDTWEICGTKLCVPLAKQSQAVLITAKTDDGIMLFLIDPSDANIDLLAMPNTAKEPQYQMTLNKVCVDAKNVLCEAVTREMIAWVVQRMTVAYCAMQLGLADRAMRMTASYTAEREQFGVPIATFQSVGHRAADCYLKIYCLRMVTAQAVTLLSSQQQAENEVSIAKIWAGDCGHFVSYAAQHLHGGMGVDKDYPLWRYCIWMRHIELMLGSSAQHLAELGKRIARGDVYAA